VTSLSEGKIDLVTLGDTAPAAARERASLRRLGRVRWGLAAGFVLLLIVASAVFAPWIAPTIRSPSTSATASGLPPGWTAASPLTRSARTRSGAICSPA